jgi:hypothetical protein
VVNVGFIDSITTLPITVAFSPQARQNYAVLDQYTSTSKIILYNIESSKDIIIPVRIDQGVTRYYGVLDHPKFNINNVNDVVIPFSLLAVNFTETYTKRNKLFYLATVSYQFWS